ncbi:MAG: malate dehydrogenase [Chlamydiia bacterium]|nr:malate dehydrogenase [Chlamydiia bacterium]
MTGGAGNICYSLLFRIASGELFGIETLVDLRVLETKESINCMKGVKMELMDCAYPLLNSIKTTTSPDEAFEGVDYAFLVGAKPRSKGMERSDLLKENGKIFQVQGKALNRSNNAKVLVVGNPCNTNALILKYAAKDLNPFNIRAMTRLDQNRAAAQVAKRAGVPVSKVKNIGIWGNHSAKMVTDYLHIQIDGDKAVDVIQDLEFFQKTLFEKVAQRGTEIMEARGLSSAASAANAAIDSMKDWIGSDVMHSAGIYSEGNPYGIDNDLYFSFPLVNGRIIEGLQIDEFLEQKIKETENELIEERESVRAFL